MMVYKKIRAFFNPEEFQGWGKKRSYFEGWYYKVVDREKEYAFAIIPGIAMDGNGNSHAFIQVLDGNSHASAYHRFQTETFRAVSGKLDITIAENNFTRNKIRVDLPDLKGILTLTGIVPWPKTLFSPGIMGPYSFVPFMECYHGIVSMDHSVEGFLETNREKIDFTGGRGYIEKDWGHSFPSAYVWIQSNHFSHTGISFKASVAKIPWIGNSFTGFIAGLWFDGYLFRFTTYNRTKLVLLDITPDTVDLMMKNRQHTLKVRAERKEAVGLASPISGFRKDGSKKAWLARLKSPSSGTATEKSSLTIADTAPALK